jgi:N-acetylglucosamine-6-phosphate deacetylase
LRLGVAAAVVGGTLVRGDVAVAGDQVVAVGLSGHGTGIAAPGLVDLQVNGYAGVDVLTGSLEELEAMSLALLRTGVVAFQPTLITAEPSQTIDAISRLEQLRQRSALGARVLGVHLEGPFLSSRRAGTHPVGHLKPPDEALLSQLLSAGSVTMVTLAPEIPGGLELIAACRRRGVVVALGHSDATAAQADAAFAAGASAVTHLFNAMAPMSARSPGLAGVALTRSDVTVQLIADGIHVADEMIRLAFAAAGGRCALVSDVLSVGGSAQHAARLGEILVEVSDGVARRADGTIAGALAALPAGLARLVALGFSMETAVQATTERPARLIGDERAGRLLPGSRADLVVLDEVGIVQRVFFGGRELELD